VARWQLWVNHVVSCRRRRLPIHPRYRTFSASQRTDAQDQKRLSRVLDSWNGTAIDHILAACDGRCARREEERD
jgi:hypothetical protein